MYFDMGPDGTSVVTGRKADVNPVSNFQKPNTTFDSETGGENVIYWQTNVYGQTRNA